jgi:hypothetical protein
MLFNGTHCPSADLKEGGSAVGPYRRRMQNPTTIDFQEAPVPSGEQGLPVKVGQVQNRPNQFQGLTERLLKYSLAVQRLLVHVGALLSCELWRQQAKQKKYRNLGTK